MNWDLNLQSLAAVPLVLAAFVYSAWALMPASWRRKLALVMVRVDWLARMPAIVRASRAPERCGCDGCDKPTAAARTGSGNAGTQVIRVTHRRRAD